MKLRDYFIETLSKYEQEQDSINMLWEEIETAYSAPGRHYHNMTHLENMLVQLLAVKDQLKQWEVIVLALCYHDIVYEALGSDNEAESAALAEKRLRSLFPQILDAVTEMIMATKKHELHHSGDINFFTDADLSILGADKETYLQYAAAIRNEYAAVPDELYIPGRKKVLKHFLEMEDIFKTPFFKERLETQARINIEQEMNRL